MLYMDNVGMSCMSNLMLRRNYVPQVHAQSRFWVVKTMTPLLLIDLDYALEQL